MTPNKQQRPLRKTLRQESKGISHKHVRKIEGIRRPVMRQKDANAVAKILGSEMRLAHDVEKPGLETALVAVRTQMEGTNRNFNGAEFDRSYNEGFTKGWSA